MSVESNFLAMLRNNRLPWYVNFEKSVETYIKEYSLSSVIVKRSLKTGSVNNVQKFKILKKNQINVFKNLCGMKEIYPYTVAISSIPTDYLALNTAASITFNLFKRLRCDFKFINSNFNYKESSLMDYKIIVIYNIVPVMSFERIYNIRDLILKYPKALKLIVVGGTHGLDYFDNYLRMPLSSMLHVIGGPSHNDYLKFLSEPTFEAPVFTHEMKQLLKPLAIQSTVKK